jgi:hypothetical protein
VHAVTTSAAASSATFAAMNKHSTTPLSVAIARMPSPRVVNAPTTTGQREKKASRPPTSRLRAIRR